VATVPIDELEMIVTLVIGGFVKDSVKAMHGKYIHLLQIELLNIK
jgi:hypothetical protein